MLSIALAHAIKGRRVFPFHLDPRRGGGFDKKPLVKWKDGATSDEATIRRWWRRWPNAHAGWALPEGLVIIDIDYPDVFADAGLELPVAPRQDTPSGGSHHLYVTDGRPVRQTTFPGGDTRVGGKGFVGLYSAQSFAGEPAAASEWLYALNQGRESEPGDATPPEMGTGDEILGWLGLVMTHVKLSRETVYAMLVAEREAGRIVDRDEARPWEATDLWRIAGQGAKWRPAEVVPPFKVRRVRNGVVVEVDGVRVAGAFAFESLGAAMRDGVKPVAMLVDDWLPRGVIVWMASEPEAGKTWVGLWLAARVIAAGGTVCYLDAELGRDIIVQRLVALGADPAQVDGGLDYLAFPALAMADAAAWAIEAEARRWDLAVFDPATDFLANAGIDENAGDQVTEWIKTFPEAVIRHGGTVLVADHVVKSGESRGYPIGSRAKKAKAKVGYELTLKELFDGQTVGEVLVVRSKNTISAPIPRRRSMAVGPLEGHGSFGFREIPDSGKTSDGHALDAMAWVIATTLRDNGATAPSTALAQRNLTGLIHGNAVFKAEAARLAATSPKYPVQSFAGPKGAIRYWVDPSYSGAAPKVFRNRTSATPE
jgi:hypothetical protein